jgi:hypothetical protein
MASRIADATSGRSFSACCSVKNLGIIEMRRRLRAALAWLSAGNLNP